MAVATAPPICMSPLRLVVDVHSAVHRVTHSPPFCPSVLSLNCLCFLVTLSRCCLVVYACGGRPGAMGQAPSGRSYLNPLAWFERRDDRERRWRIRTAPKPVRVAAVVALFLVLVLSSLVWFFLVILLFCLRPCLCPCVCVSVCLSVCLSVHQPPIWVGLKKRKPTKVRVFTSSWWQCSAKVCLRRVSSCWCCRHRRDPLVSAGTIPPPQRVDATGVR